MSRPLNAFAFPRRRTIQRQAQPDAARLFYFSALRALMSKAHALVTAELLPLLHELAPDTKEDTSDAERARAKVQELAKRFGRNLTPNKLAPLAAQVAHRTSEFQKAQLQAQLRGVLTVNPFIRDEKLADQMAKFTAENVSLIRTVPERYFAQVETTVADGINAGQRATTIAKELERRYEVSESDAARIANDQAGKFFGALNQSRQEELGITGYVWTTAHDTRVRDNHEHLDGTEQTWADPPEGGGTDENEAGHPGSGINCRCQALPNLAGILGA